MTTRGTVAAGRLADRYRLTQRRTQRSAVRATALLLAVLALALGHGSWRSDVTRDPGTAPVPALPAGHAEPRDDVPGAAGSSDAP